MEAGIRRAFEDNNGDGACGAIIIVPLGGAQDHRARPLVLCSGPNGAEQEFDQVHVHGVISFYIERQGLR